MRRRCCHLPRRSIACMHKQVSHRKTHPSARALRRLRARACANSRSWCEALQVWECGGIQEAVRTTMLPANESERRERKDGLASRPFSLTLERFEFERFETASNRSRAARKAVRPRVRRATLPPSGHPAIRARPLHGTHRASIPFPSHSRPHTFRWPRNLRNARALGYVLR